VRMRWYAVIAVTALFCGFLSRQLQGEWDNKGPWDSEGSGWDSNPGTTPDTSGPSNPLILTAITYTSDSLIISWNPGVITDGDSVGIWFKTVDFPDSADDPTAARRPGFGLTDSVDTVPGLLENTIYFFAAMVKDSAGNWSDTTGAASDTARTFRAVWWDTNWTARRVVRIDTTNLVGDVDSFPVMMFIDSSRVDFTTLGDSGFSIRFVDQNDTTLLAHEIEHWDSGGTSYVWVMVPNIKATGRDSFFMYYGNPSAGDCTNTSALWDTNKYTAVWHLDEPSGDDTFDDQTDNNNTGGGFGPPKDTTGQFFRGAAFDSNDFIRVPPTPNIENTGDFTMSMWIDFDPVAVDMSLMSKREVFGTMDWVWFFRTANTDIEFFWGNGNAHRNFDGEGWISGVTFHHLFTLVRQDSNWFGYSDNILDVDTTLDDTIPTGDTLRIGGFGPEFPDKGMRGLVDEVRIQQVARDSAWVVTDFWNGFDAILDISAEEMR